MREGTVRKRRASEGGVLPGGEALLVRQNPVFSDQRAPTQMNPPKIT